MSTATLSPSASAVASAAPTVQVNYTICPIYAASHIANELGWIEEEIRKVGGTLRYLRSFADNGHQPHFSHKLDNLFRDGGNIPSIWAKADNADTTLLGLTAFPQGGGQILVRADSGIRRVADLKGRKIGLSKSLNAGKVDWWRAASERGIELALSLAGLSRQDVQIVDVVHEDTHFTAASDNFPRNPAEGWQRFRQKTKPGLVPEIESLHRGEVDAVYTKPGRTFALERTGLFTVIEDLSSHPDWTLQISNSPWALTVNTELAQKHPEIVVAWLRASIRAGRWANANRAAAAELLNRVTIPPTPADTFRAFASVDFVPNLSVQNLAGVEIQKQFLVSRGYIKRDFDLNQWAAPRFLEQALKSL